MNGHSDAIGRLSSSHQAGRCPGAGASLRQSTERETVLVRGLENQAAFPEHTARYRQETRDAEQRGAIRAIQPSGQR